MIKRAIVTTAAASLLLLVYKKAQLEKVNPYVEPFREDTTQPNQKHRAPASKNQPSKKQQAPSFAPSLQKRSSETYKEKDTSSSTNAPYSNEEISATSSSVSYPNSSKTSSRASTSYSDTSVSDSSENSRDIASDDPSSTASSSETAYSTDETLSTGASYAGGGFIGTTDEDDNTDTTDSGGGESFSCSTNFGSGNYNSTLNITVSCTNSASIKYCLTKDATCCDASTDSVVTYSGGIFIGPSNGSYCISIYSEDSDDTSTSLISRTYNIHPNNPSLITATPLIYAQTTELPLHTYMTSDDFGKNNHTIKQINFKSHNPIDDGDTCFDLYNDQSGFSSPAPSELIAETNVSGLNPSDQLEIPLTPAKLSYGDNHMVSFVKNANANPARYSCESQLFTLVDFPLFDSSSISSDTAVSNTREFSGGFQTLGFFQETLSLPREPAGSAHNTKDQQKLETGFFAIMY